jgi:hypothetical protein
MRRALYAWLDRPGVVSRLLALLVVVVVLGIGGALAWKTSQPEDTISTLAPLSSSKSLAAANEYVKTTRFDEQVRELPLAFAKGYNMHLALYDPRLDKIVRLAEVERSRQLPPWYMAFSTLNEARALRDPAYAIGALRSVREALKQRGFVIRDQERLMRGIRVFIEKDVSRIIFAAKDPHLNVSDMETREIVYQTLLHKLGITRFEHEELVALHFILTLDALPLYSEPADQKQRNSFRLVH